MNSSRPRLVVINNMPAFYRTAPFAALCRSFSEATGGSARVAYQVRRDPSRRSEWFFSTDDELEFNHSFQSAATVSSRNTVAYPLRFGVKTFVGFQPTHIFAAGWDVPLTMAASAYRRIRASTTLGLWVESNPTTGARNDGASARFRRTVVGAADFALTPTAASADYVQEIVGRRVPVLNAMNPVVVPRLADRSTRTARLVFVGDLSMRKGYDRFLAACRAAEGEITGVAWGRDTGEIPCPRGPHVEYRGEAPFDEIRRALTSNDILFIPSRQDPAPLTFSEGLGMGLRILLSEQVAYAQTASQFPGTESVDADQTVHVLAAIQRLRGVDRPSRDVSSLVTPNHWAAQVLRGLLEPHD